MLRYVMICALTLTACATTPASTQAAAVKPVPVPSLAPNRDPAIMAQAEKFKAWQADFIARAIAKGYDAVTVRDLIGGATFKPSAVKSNDSQPEFTKPIWSYVKGAASGPRLESGKSKLASNTGSFDRIEAAYGVDRNILTAIWGLESNFGSNLGTYDVVDALSSFAYDGRRMAFGEAQLFAVLDLLRDRKVRREQLKSSWAGAMGMTQFIPATFRDYAVDFDGDGNMNLWGNAQDALGSAANYLSKSGWERGLPVMAEVKLPAGFDYSLSDGRKKTVSEWAALGAAPVQGGGFTPAAANVAAKLYIPAGSKGPALLTFKNFDVIKRYNNSNSYAMGITALALGFNGKRAISTPWPEGDEALSLTQKKKLQEALTRQGFKTGGVDGLIGPNSMAAIRGWQAANGAVADGYVEKRLWLRILKGAGMTP